MTSLLQEKKNYSLEDHVHMFIENENMSKIEIESLIIKKHPKKFDELFTNMQQENFPTDHITEELEIFKDNIHNQLTKCNTEIGVIYTDKILRSPSSDKKIINKRQELIRNICHKYNEKTDNNINELRKSINDVLWFFKQKNEHSDYIYSMMYFNNSYLKFLNNNEPFLTISNAYKIIISPIMCAVSPLVYILVPFVIMKFMGVNIPIKFFLKLMWEQSNMISIPFIKNEFLKTIIKWFSKAISIFLYAQNVYYTYNTSKITINISNFFQKKIENIKKILQINTGLIENFNDILEKEENGFKRIENGNIYNGSYSILSNKGVILKDFYEFVENKDNFLSVLNNIGFIDCYFGIAKMIREKSYYHIPRIIESTRPILKLEGLWHPAVQKDKNIRNSIEFDEKNRNYILTGPNAAGKSTFIKSVFLNIYLAQTVGICNSEKMEFTPFSYFLTGIRNQDSQGHESLFEAEVHKIRDYINILKVQKGFTFSILDEIFTSTNFQEGYSASYGMCETIGKMENSLHIVATHYTNLYKIVKKKELCFKNIRFSVIFRDESIIFPYKLENGYSKQFIALKLMVNKKCDGEFMNNCVKFLEHYVKKKSPKKKKIKIV
jgi:DNA mismatch repair ATPase MutS